MTKINITLNKEEPLFSLNEHVVCFVQNSKPDEIKKSLVDWQKSLGLDEGVENKDKLQAIRSISNFLKKEEEGILKEDDINRLSESLFKCSNFNDEKRRADFDSKLTRTSKTGNITKVKVAEGEWGKLSKDQEEYRLDPKSLKLDEIGAKYALYPVSDIGIQVSANRGTTSDDKPAAAVQERTTQALHNQASMALQ